MRSILMLAAVIAGVAAYMARYADKTVPPQAATEARAAAATQATPASLTNNSRSLVIAGDRQGHFQVEARVDGRRIGFLVDTGASVIALTAKDAARLGIHPRPSEYTVQVHTANGITKAAPVQLGMVELGNIVVRDVRALVQAEGALSENLLGMSFLSRVKFTHERGKLVLEQ
jgi:aspartyl protease family protein